MVYGLGPRVRNVRLQPQQPMRRSRTPVRPWRSLDEGRRLELVESALLPANEFIDAYPLAL